MRVRHLLGAGLAIALVACGSPPATDDGPIEGTWELRSGRAGGVPVPVLDDWPVTLIIEGSSVGGTSACNSYGGRIVAVGGGIDIVDFAMTAMACEDRVMEVEAAFTSALLRVTRIARDGTSLILDGPDVELRFGELAPPPTAELVDTIWVLETVVVSHLASPPMGDRATLEIRTDGSFAGETGCRSFVGTWVEQGDRILATNLAADERECPPELADQDSGVFSVIGDGFVPVITGELLTLGDVGGTGLVYRAAE
jgi:heat shock protein HslJ